MIDRANLKIIIEEVIYSIIAEKIVERYKEKSKKILVLFSNTNTGFEESMEAINRLKNDGYTIKVVLDKGDTGLISEESIRNLLGDVIVKDSTNIYDLVDESSIVIVACLSIDSASKIANLISDTRVTKAVSHGIVTGKPIIASINGACPINLQKNEEGINNIIKPYSEMMTRNLEKIESFGVKLSRSHRIDSKAGRVNSMLMKNTSKSKLTIDKDILTESDIKECNKDSVIYVYKKTKFTSLAIDEIQKKNITIIKLN